MIKRMTLIGGGPGGYTAAFAAARAGIDVTLVEQSRLGGVCLNTGCIPTKTLKSSADALELALRLSDFGVTLPQGTDGVRIDMPAVVERKENVCNVLRTGLEKTCAKLKITLLRGHGRVMSSSLVQVRMEDGSIQDVEGDAVVLATGSKIFELPQLPFDHTHILNSDDALALKDIPRRLVIVGGGVIGCEMACIYKAFGSHVTLVEGLDRLLPMPSIDADISKLLQREMKKHGIVCEVGRTLNDVKKVDGQMQGTLGPSPFLEKHSASQKKEASIEMDAVLVVVGRSPQVEGLGLDEAGVKTDARGWIEVDEYMQTSVPNIYAIGDAVGPHHVMLAHVAAAEGLCVVEHCLAQSQQGTQGAQAHPMNYNAVPSAIFTSPEIGCVGMSEAQAKEAGYDVLCSTVQMRELGKAHAMGELPGFFKLVADKTTKKLLGAHVSGAHASDLIAELALALNMGATLEDVAHTIHAHPTLAEGVLEAALLACE